MAKLNKRYTGLFCTCCGVKAETIWNNILKRGKPHTIGLKLGVHYVPAGRNYFYAANPIAYCQNCGKKLSHNEMKFEKEEIGECHGVPQFQYPMAYCCSDCGFIYN